MRIAQEPCLAPYFYTRLLSAAGINAITSCNARICCIPGDGPSGEVLVRFDLRHDVPMYFQTNFERPACRSSSIRMAQVFC